MRTSTPVSGATVLWFFGTAALGVAIWFITFALGWGAASAFEVGVLFAMNIAGAFFSAAALSTFRATHPIFWSTGFAMPILCWGVFCLLVAPFNKLGVLWWTAIGTTTEVSALVGAFVGRAVRRMVST